MEGYIKYECHNYFMGIGKKFVMDCYNFCNLLICYIHLLTQYYFLCLATSELVDIKKKHIERNLCFNHADKFLDTLTKLRKSLTEI